MNNFKTDFLDIDKIYMLTDLHFGVRSNSEEWLDIQKDYFYNFFINDVLSKSIHHHRDALIILGDIFDNRQYINILVMHEVIKLFEKLAEIFKKGVYIIIGNHDIWAKNSNDITSVDCLKHIPGINIIKETTILNTNHGISLTLMPWQKDEEMEKETLASLSEIVNNRTKYLLCHSEVRGVSLNQYSKQEKGIEVDAFKDFKKVYSGHIHYSQKKKNIHFLGNPYEMTRSDIDNKKGIVILNLADEKEEFIENTYSPRFKKFFLKDILDITLDDFKLKIKNSFVDINIPSSVVAKYNFNNFMNTLDGFARKIEPQIYDDFKDSGLIASITDEEGELSNMDIISITNRYMDKASYDDAMKDRIINKIKDLYINTNKNEV